MGRNCPTFLKLMEIMNNTVSFKPLEVPKLLEGEILDDEDFPFNPPEPSNVVWYLVKAEYLDLKCLAYLDQHTNYMMIFPDEDPESAKLCSDIFGDSESFFSNESDAKKIYFDELGDIYRKMTTLKKEVLSLWLQNYIAISRSLDCQTHQQIQEYIWLVLKEMRKTHDVLCARFEEIVNEFEL